MAVIEYLVDHASECAVDDIIEQNFQISVRFLIYHLEFALVPLSSNGLFFSIPVSSSLIHFLQLLSSFEYVEPNGKDLGINVRKKAENIVALLNDKDKMMRNRGVWS